MFVRVLFAVLLTCTALVARAEGGAPTILVLGDSLSAAYGIPASKGWVALLQERLRERGYPQRVVNASISGETAAGGLARLPALLDRHKPQMVLIELGGNDGLRGQPLGRLEENLTRMVSASREAGAEAVLFEMRIPSNYGPTYTEGFHATFGKVAQSVKAPLVPFFLETIALDPDAFQDDGIHPTVSAQPAMLETAWPALEAALKK